MSTEVLDVLVVASSPASWTKTGGATLVDALTDSDDATYARSNTPNVLCKFGCGDPGAVTGQLVSVCPFVRSKKDGTKLARAHVLGYYGRKYPDYVNTGVALSIPTGAAAADQEIAAHNGLHDFTYLGRGGEQDATYAGLGLWDSDSTTNRAIVYEAGLKAYYLEPAAIAAPSAPTGTVNDSQAPDCTAEVSAIVEDWQVPSGEAPWLCGGDVEYRIYADADVPAGSTAPPPLATPVWETVVRFTEATYGDGTTPSTQNVTASPDVSLSNGDYWIFARVSRDLPSGSQLYWSAWSYGEFTIDVDPPNAPTLETTANSVEQCVDLAVTATTTTGYEDDSYEVSVERSDDGATWAKVRACQDVAIALGAHEVGADYEAPRAFAVTYRARVSAELTGDGTRLWSAWATDAVTTPAAAGWNLKVPEQSTLNWIGVSVLADPDAERDQEVAVFHPLDRLGAVAVSAPVAGETGALAIFAKGATEIAVLEDIVAWEGALYLETAFGDALYIRALDVAWQFGGTPSAPRRTATLQYVEVGAPAVS